MKIKENFVLQKVMEDNLVVPIAGEADKLHGIIKLSETGAYIWELLEKGVESNSELAEALAAEYGIFSDDAMNDITVFLGQLDQFGCLEK